FVEQPRRFAIVDDCERILLLPLRCRIDMCRQVRAVLRLERRLRHLRRAGEIELEAVLIVRIELPVLGGGGATDPQNTYENHSRETHFGSSNECPREPRGIDMAPSLPRRSSKSGGGNSDRNPVWA